MPQDRIHVLVIDDDQDDFHLLKDLLGEVQSQKFDLNGLPLMKWAN